VVGVVSLGVELSDRAGLMLALTGGAILSDCRRDCVLPDFG